jgi:hypothetical protein
MGGMYIFIGLLLICLWIFPGHKEWVVHYGVQLLSGEKIKVSVKGKDENHLLLEGINHPFKDEIDPAQLFNKYKDVWIVLDAPHKFNFVQVFGGILLFFGVFIVWFYMREIRKEKRKLRTVELLR